LKLFKGQYQFVFLLQPPENIPPTSIFRLAIYDAARQIVAMTDISGERLVKAEKSASGLLSIGIPSSRFHEGSYRLVFSQVEPPGREELVVTEFKVVAPQN
jgi:hypothetical protein